MLTYWVFFVYENIAIRLDKVKWRNRLKTIIPTFKIKRKWIEFKNIKKSILLYKI